jgi:hypothetical protein
MTDFQFELFPLHSPLLGESLLVSFPPLINMLKFRGSSHLSRDLVYRFSQPNTNLPTESSYNTGVTQSTVHPGKPSASRLTRTAYGLKARRLNNFEPLSPHRAVWKSLALREVPLRQSFQS